MRRHAAIALAFALFWALLTPVVSSRALFFSNDGPQHLYAAVAKGHPDDGRQFGSFVAAHAPVSTRGFFELFTLLEPAFGWEGAYRATVWLIASLWVFGAFLFLRAAQPRSPALAFLSFPLVLQHALYAGFFPFLCGSALGMLACAAVLRVRHRVASVALATALLWLSALGHVFAAGCCGILAAVCVWTEPRVPRLKRTVAIVVMAIPAARVFFEAFAERYTAGQREELSTLAERTFLLAEGFQVGGFWRPLSFLVLLALALVVSLKNVRILDLRQRAFVALSIAALGIVLVFGAHLGSWDFGGLRVLPVGFLALLAGAPLAAMDRRWRVLAGTAAAAYLAATAWWAVRWTSEVERTWGDVVDTAHSIPTRPMTWFPVIAASPETLQELRPFGVVPESRVGQLLVLGAGGVVADSHDSDPTIHQVLRKPGVALPPEDPRLPSSPALLARSRDEQLAYLPRVASLAAPYDGILLFARPGADDFIEPLRARGWVLLWRSGDVAMLGLEGCSARVRFEGAKGRVAWRFGVWPVKTAHEVGDVEPGVEVLLTRQPCGEAWVRPREGACQSTDGSGFTRGVLRPDHEEELVCVVQP